MVVNKRVTALVITNKSINKDSFCHLLNQSPILFFILLFALTFIYKRGIIHTKTPTCEHIITKRAIDKSINRVIFSHICEIL